MKNEIITERDLGLEVLEGKKTEFYSENNNNMTIRYGARGIVEGKDGKIAVIYKKNKNEYKLPGGGVDKGEDFKEAFKRECIEEIGCMIENVEYLFDIEEDHINDNFKQISKVYIAKVKDVTNILENNTILCDKHNKRIGIQAKNCKSREKRMQFIAEKIQEGSVRYINGEAGINARYNRKLEEYKREER